MRQMLVAVLLSAFLAASAHAQEPGRTYRVGVLTLNRQQLVTKPRDMLPRLAQSGFIEGRNLILDVRFGLVDQLPELARDLAARSDVIVATGIYPIRAASEATRTVPIVYFGFDPARMGLAQSLNRPGGNVTGIMMGGGEGKLVELLHDAFPNARRIAVLFPRGLAGGSEDLIAAMANVGVDVRLFYADRQEEYPVAFVAMREAGMEAVSIANTPLYFGDIEQLLALAREARLPTGRP